MHLIQDVVKAFHAFAAHTTEHAIEQTYKMGYDKGVADTQAKYQAGLAGSSAAAAPAAPAAESGASNEEQKAGSENTPSGAASGEGEVASGAAEGAKT